MATARSARQQLGYPDRQTRFNYPVPYLVHKVSKFPKRWKLLEITIKRHPLGYIMFEHPDRGRNGEERKSELVLHSGRRRIRGL